MHLAVGGGTFQSFVNALDTAGVSRSSATITLSCADRRLAHSHIRRLQDVFKLLSLALFTDATDAEAFFESCSDHSSNTANEFASQIAAILGVNVTSTMTVTAVPYSTSAAYHSVVAGALALIGAFVRIA